MLNEETTIAVTGLAAISAAGVGLAPLQEALRTGTSCLSPVPNEILGEAGHRWGKAEAFRAGDFMPPLKARKFDRCSLLAVAATGLALQHAGLDLATFPRERVGIVLGCGFGGITNSVEFLSGYFRSGVEGLAPLLFPNTVANAAASNASIEHRFSGPNVTIVQRFGSAESALLMACRFLEEGRADVMLTGGVDELNPLMLRGFKELGQLRSYAAGFGEGSGLLVLERPDHARSRGATVRGTIGPIRTVGRLLPGAEAEGLDRLLAGLPAPGRVSLSGTAELCPLLLDRLPAVPRLALAPLVGRSLAMGGLALAALFLSLAPGQRGLHLAASPEGPYYAIDCRGGAA